MTSYLLVPGANHGGWWYAPVVERLRSAGHRATALTLPGLDPDAPLPTQLITLDDHVAAAREALDAFLADDGDRAGAAASAGTADDPVVLVGHSYGGSIINALADADPSRIDALIYLDALLPDDGDSAWSMTNDEEHAWFIGGSEKTGGYVDPMPFFDERARPHPLATLMQASKLTGAWREVATKEFVIATEWQGSESTLGAMYDKARSDPSITVHEWPVSHNILRDGPDRLVEFLLSVSDRASSASPARA